MADKRSLFAGILIGAGLALAIREGVGLIARRRGGWQLDNWHGSTQDHPECFRTTHSVLEPEDSRTESYVPNAVHEDHSWMESQGRAHGRRRFGLFRNGGLDQQRMSRNAERIANAGDPYEHVAEGETVAGNPRRQEPEGVESGSRTTTSTEAELRRTGTDDNPVRYTRPTDAQAASGGEAPFLKEDK